MQPAWDWKESQVEQYPKYTTHMPASHLLLTQASSDPGLAMHTHEHMKVPLTESALSCWLQVVALWCCVFSKSYLEMPGIETVTICMLTMCNNIEQIPVHSPSITFHIFPAHFDSVIVSERWHMHNLLNWHTEKVWLAWNTMELLFITQFITILVLEPFREDLHLKKICVF